MTRTLNNSIGLYMDWSRLRTAPKTATRQSLRVLEDLTEKEFLAFEELYGMAFRRPTGIEIAEWQVARKALKIDGKWQVRPTVGKRSSQEEFQAVNTWTE